MEYGLRIKKGDVGGTIVAALTRYAVCRGMGILIVEKRRANDSRQQRTISDCRTTTSDKSDVPPHPRCRRDRN